MYRTEHVFIKKSVTISGTGIKINFKSCSVDTVQNNNATANISVSEPLVSYGTNSSAPPVVSAFNGDEAHVGTATSANDVTLSATSPLGQYTENVKPMWRETFCHALRMEHLSGPLVQQIADILRRDNIKKEDWDENFIKDVWLSSDFIRMVRSVKKFRDLVFTDDQLDFTVKKTEKQLEKYRELHRKSELFLVELNEAYNKERDIADAIKPVSTIKECRKLSEDIKTNHRKICRKVYELLYEEKESNVSASVEVAEEEKEEQEEGEEEDKEEETLEGLRAELAEARKEANELRVEVGELRKANYFLGMDKERLTAEVEELDQRIRVFINPLELETTTSTAKRTRSSSRNIR